MKSLKQKNIAIVFLAAAMLFCGAQKASAVDVFRFNDSDGLRTCYCSKTDMNTISDAKNKTIKSAGVNAQPNDKFANQELCAKSCYAKGYVSYVLYDKQYSSDENNAANVSWNVMKNIPEEFKPKTGATAAAGPTVQDWSIPGTSVDAGSGIVKCGRPGQNMCTLCDLIKGFNEVIQYIMKIAIGVALLAMAVGGVLYVVSAGESGTMEMAKSAITNAAIGFVIVFAAYLIVNTTVTYLGTTGTLGMKTATTWGQFDCAASSTGIPNK